MRRYKNALLVSLAICAVIGIILVRTARQHGLNTQLIKAVKNHESETVIALLKRGADPNTQDAMDDQLSIWARIQASLSIGGRTRDSRISVLQRAINYQYDDIALALIDDPRTDVHAHLRGSDSLLYQSIDRGNALFDALLARGGWDPNEMGRDGNNILMKAARSQADPCGVKLLALGARPATGPSSPKEMLQQVVQNGLYHFCEKLLETGIDLSEERKNGQLMVAASGRGHLELVKLLLKHGSPINTPNKSPLIAATECRSLPVVKYLMDHGAVLDGNGKYPDAVHTAVRCRTIEILRYFADHGADFKKLDQSGSSLMVLAASNNDSETIKLLIEHGVLVNGSGRDLETPLMAASRTGNVDSLKLLLDRGAEVDQLNSPGTRTAFMCAAERGNKSAVLFLLSRGANVNIVGRDSTWSQYPMKFTPGKTPAKPVVFREVRPTALSLATAKGHQHIVQILKAAGAK